MKLILIAAFVFSSLGTDGVVFAEESDDLLSILGGKSSADSATFQERHELTLALKKRIGKTTPEQNIFFSFLDSNNFEKALFQWDSAFAKTPFATTGNGRALYSFLLFKNGLEANGVENLFHITRPGAVMSEIVKIWRQLAPHDHKVWDVVEVNWSPEWTSYFDVATEVQVKSRKIYSLEDTKRLLKVLSRTKLNSKQRAKLQWQMVLSLAVNDDIVKAAKVLAHLMKDKNNVVSRDLMTITAARLLYQQGYLQPAVNYYGKIPKRSEYWFTAQEEMAWAYIRKGEPQNTMAITKTLLNPAFTPQVGPETVFLQALGELKVCDYPGVAGSIQVFRERFKNKAQSLTALIESPKNEDTEKLLSNLRDGQVRLLDLGKAGLRLPSYVSRDVILRELANTVATAQNEVKLADGLYQRSLTGGSDKVGFQENFAHLRTKVQSRLQAAQSGFFNRVKDHAKDEVQEINRILQKMHIVEAELIQQISQAQKVIRASSGKVNLKRGTTGSLAKYSMRFPVKDEIWFDELSNYKIDIKKGCQALAKSGQ